MRETIAAASEYAVLLIDTVAVIVVVYSTLEAVIAALGFVLRRGTPQERRDIWLRYARWLVAALTFLLAADIIETTLAPDWQSLVSIAVIAVIRTFLNYFLERDMDEVRERQHAISEAKI